MAELDKQGLLELIAGIAPGRGTAEHESDDEAFYRNFLPIPNYKFVLEPDTLLVLGGRGAGKTELFRLLAKEPGRQILVEHTGIRSLPDLKSTFWIPAFGRALRQGKEFPPPEVVAQSMKGASGDAWRRFWIGMVLGVVLKRKEDLGNQKWLSELATDTGAALGKLPMLSQWLPLVSRDLETINFSLDQLDEQLKRENKWLFVTYDELDRLLPEHAALALPIRELLAFWLDRWRRWERIRPKVFLRTDLFQEEFLGFPDASKLQGHQVRLEWRADDLYQLLVKRLANSGEAMADYVRRVRKLLPTEPNDLLGWLPALNSSLFQQLIERMIGKFMGGNPRKGYTYSWIPNHLQDAGGRIAPRSFLKLFSLAARNRLDEPSAPVSGEHQLLLPTNLQAALIQTSEERIFELTQEEYPWLEALKSSLGNREVPMDTRSFLKALRVTHWPPSTKLPASQPPGILRAMLQLGIVEQRLGDKINMPEIYRYGFKLKRRGGIKRPR